jgi:hypothetical protein
MRRAGAWIAGVILRLVTRRPDAASKRSHTSGSRRAMAGVAGSAIALIAVSACSGPRPPLNPPRLVLSGQTDMAIQLFMQANILLANYYGFQTIRYSELQARSAAAGFSTLPFMPPETIRATPELVNFANTYENNAAMLDAVLKKYGGYKVLVKYYIRTGLRASQLICRNYLLGLEENNRYLEFLRKEFGIAATLASGILELTHANRTLLSTALITRSFVDSTILAYEEYRFLSIDRESARSLVEAAQNKYAEYYLAQVDNATPGSNSTTGGYTFSDAINAVSTIEYQCTREGIRHLLNRSVNNSPTNIEIDQTTGQVIFKSATDTDPATGKFAPPTRDNKAPPPLPPAPPPPPPPVVVVPAPAPPPVVLAPAPAVVAPAPAVADSTGTSQANRKPCADAPDEAARRLLDFICPAGVIENARRNDLSRLMQQIDATMANRVMVVLTVKRHGDLRQKLLAAAIQANLVTR